MAPNRIRNTGMINLATPVEVPVARLVSVRSENAWFNSNFIFELPRILTSLGLPVAEATAATDATDATDTTVFADVLAVTVEQGSSVPLSTLTEGDNIVVAEASGVGPVPRTVAVKAEDTIISELTSKEIAIRPDRPDPPGAHVDQLSQFRLLAILGAVRNIRWFRFIPGAFISLAIFGRELFRKGDNDSLSSRSQPSELVEPATSERDSLFDSPV